MDPSASTESRAGTSIAVICVTLIIATTAVALRLFTRVRLIKTFGWDDYAAVASLILTIACGICVGTEIPHGLGIHTRLLSPETISLYMRSFYASIVLYNASLTAVKMTFLLQYWRVLTIGRLQKAVLMLGILVMCWCFSQLMIVIFTCKPVYKFWDPEAPGYCIPNLPFWYWNAAGNIISDMIIFVLPLPVFWRLDLPVTQRVILVCIFSVGFFTCAISVIRIKYLHQSDDFTFENVESSSWSLGELCSGITCAALPTLRPLAARFIPCLETKDQTGRSSAKRLSPAPPLDNYVDVEEVVAMPSPTRRKRPPPVAFLGRNGTMYREQSSESVLSRHWTMFRDESSDGPSFGADEWSEGPPARRVTDFTSVGRSPEARVTTRISGGLSPRNSRPPSVRHPSARQLSVRYGVEVPQDFRISSPPGTPRRPPMSERLHSR